MSDDERLESALKEIDLTPRTSPDIHKYPEVHPDNIIAENDSYYIVSRAVVLNVSYES